MSYNSFDEILSICYEKNISFWEAVMEDDVLERNTTQKDSRTKMKATWKAMQLADQNYDKDLKSKSGLVGGDGHKMELYGELHQQTSLCGNFLNKVMASALKMGESNACMKRIVAAPTAGACGVLPAVLVSFYKEKKCTEEDIINAMYVAAGIGKIIATRAYISGAAGGCQAEIGTASAMATGAMVFLMGGNSTQIGQGVAISLKNMLGLVCDPVAGLVEVPCVKRNVLGAMNALSSADMVLAGISSKIPPDQVIDAMKEVGDKMDFTLKETALGGLAVTSEGMKIAKKMLSDN